jgi:SAM-dependent methyltransferase
MRDSRSDEAHGLDAWTNEGSGDRARPANAEGSDMAKYVLDNEAEEAGQRFTSLQECFDPVTIAHLDRTGVTSGWTCLEVGGGGVSIGRWLGGRVGSTGKVTVTDLDPHWIGADQGPNVEVIRHDVVADPLPDRTYDLVHARLVLLHLPARLSALANLVKALKPGGWLLIDDFDCTWLPFIPSCDEAGQALFLKVLAAFHRLLGEGGVDLEHGRHFYQTLTDQGLVDVQVDGHMQIWSGGSAGTRLHQANIEQLTPRLLATELLDQREISNFHRLLDDPTFSVNSYLLVSGLGRRLRD